MRSSSAEKRRRKETKKRCGRLLTDSVNCLSLVLDFPSLVLFACCLNVEKEEGKEKVEQGEERPPDF